MIIKLKENREITTVKVDVHIDPQTNNIITHVGASLMPAHKTNKGITLVALVITIIVMLILAGIVISVLRWRTRTNC